MVIAQTGFPHQSIGLCYFGIILHQEAAPLMRAHFAAGPMKDIPTISIGCLDKEVLQAVTLDQSLTTQVHYVFNISTQRIL